MALEIDDEYYMRVALGHARRGLGFTAPNPSVGCVIVKKGHIIAAAHTGVGGRPHAETIALAQAGGAAKGAMVYVTLEPCAHHGKTGPCAEALVAAGVARVVIGCVDPDPRVAGKGIEILQKAQIEVSAPVLEQLAIKSNKGFFLNILGHRPYVTLKLAVSADEKIAAMVGRRTQISGELAQNYTQLLRSQHDAILVGIETVLVDNPLLTTRIKALHPHVSIRVVLDTELRIPLDCRLVQSIEDAPLVIVYKDGAVDKIAELREKGCELIALDTRDLRRVLQSLAERGITRLLVEGGAQVFASFLDARLADEVQLVRSPKALGAAGVGVKLDALVRGFGGRLQKTRALAEDLLEIYTWEH